VLQGSRAGKTRAQAADSRAPWWEQYRERPEWADARTDEAANSTRQPSPVPRGQRPRPPLVHRCGASGCVFSRPSVAKRRGAQDARARTARSAPAKRYSVGASESGEPDLWGSVGAASGGRGTARRHSADGLAHPRRHLSHPGRARSGYLQLPHRRPAACDLFAASHRAPYQTSTEAEGARSMPRRDLAVDVHSPNPSDDCAAQAVGLDVQAVPALSTRSRSYRSCAGRVSLAPASAAQRVRTWRAGHAAGLP